MNDKIRVICSDFNRLFHRDSRHNRLVRKRFVNYLAWILLFKVFVSLLIFFAWDSYQTKQVLNAYETTADNASYLNGIITAQNKVLRERCK